MPTPLGESLLDTNLLSHITNQSSLLPLHNTTLLDQARQNNQDFELQEIASGSPSASEHSDHSKRLAASSSNSDELLSTRTVPSSQPLISSYPSSEGDSDDSQMGRRSNANGSDQGLSTGPDSQNGHVNGKMNKDLEMGRKMVLLDSPSQTSNLMSRESFSLDHEPPVIPHTPTANTSFFELPRQDRRNFMLLVLLYFLQGIPMGLAGGSVPFLLKSHLSYGQIGVFTLASYPYSLKLLWSPIIDAVWSPKVGRRKSWILPIQLCSGFAMLYMGSRAEKMMVAAGASDGSGVWTFTWWWFFLVFLCATQDIAVDGASQYAYNYPQFG